MCAAAQGRPGFEARRPVPGAPLPVLAQDNRLGPPEGLVGRSGGAAHAEVWQSCMEGGVCAAMCGRPLWMPGQPQPGACTGPAVAAASISCSTSQPSLPPPSAEEVGIRLNAAFCEHHRRHCAGQAEVQRRCGPVAELEAELERAFRRLPLPDRCPNSDGRCREWAESGGWCCSGVQRCT